MKYLMSYTYWDHDGSIGNGRAFLTTNGKLAEAHVWEFERLTVEENGWDNVAVMGVQELAG